MITLIDTRTRQSYVTECYSEGAKLIGVAPQTLINWERKKKDYCQLPFEQFGHWHIYYSSKVLKSSKGFAQQV